DEGEQGESRRYEACGREPGEDDGLRRAVETRVEPPPRGRHEPELPRDPAVQPVQYLPEGHQREPEDEMAGGDRRGRGHARPERRPRDLGRRDPEPQVQEPQQRPDRTVERAPERGGELIHGGATTISGRSGGRAPRPGPLPSPCPVCP